MTKQQTVTKPLPADEQQLSTEAVFETLSSRRRRFTLYYLSQVGESVTIRELSTQIAAWENGVELHAVTPKQRKRVYTALHQTHLPTMDRLDVIVYAKDRKTISITDHIQEFDLYLDIVPPDDLPWSQFYLLLSAVISVLIVIAVQGVTPFSSVGGFGYALLASGVFVVTSSLHYLRDRRTLIGAATTPPEVEPPQELTE
ncbi:hypothetical protein HKK80_10835 [Halonotius sp. F2-221B]|uniref:DUF7344 domain-containing protein n=1 Tax=Halonotius sp. F2-221B TaxID=2731620 RepID=UPI00398B8EC7